MPQGHLVYAAGNEVAVEHAVRGVGVTITCHTLDLDQQPEQLLKQVAVLGAHLAA